MIHRIVRVEYQNKINLKDFCEEFCIKQLTTFLQDKDVFLWLEFTNDVDQTLADYMLDWFESRNMLDRVGMISNIGYKKPKNARWQRVLNIQMDNHIQTLLFYHELNNHNFNSDMFKDDGGMLFLTGKPLTLNRFPVLDLIDKGELKEKSTVSLFWNDSVYQDAFNTFDFTMDRIKDLVHRYQGTPDNAKISHIDKSHNRFHCSGVPYDHTLYQSHKLSLIPETTTIYTDHRNFCSEKTFRAILNCHPFIILGQVGTLKHLEDRGYNCFKDFLPHPDYNQVSISSLSSLREHWYKIEKNCEALLNTDRNKLWSICVENQKNLFKENKLMIENFNEKTNNNLNYQKHCYDLFYWGIQPDDWVWPSWNIERKKFSR